MTDETSARSSKEYCNCDKPEPALVNHGLDSLCEKCYRLIPPKIVEDSSKGHLDPSLLMDNAACASQCKELLDDHPTRQAVLLNVYRPLWDEIERLTRDLDLRNEQIDGYERQLGIDKAGAEHTIGSEIERLLGNKPTPHETPAPRRHDRDCDCHDCHYSKKHPQVKPHHAACGCFECAPKKVSIETDDDAARLHEAATILATALACDDYQPQHTKWMTEAAAWLNRPRPALKANYCLCKGTLGWTRDAGGTPICADCRLPIRCSANGDER